ncbi:MAG TPA: NAD(P)H-quinone oxidoreductase [Casimicrobiaceae bacterium]|nr:NAD(P)H-quinone oxidoreductase [Casimicrobiaceae bacterium]
MQVPTTMRAIGMQAPGAPDVLEIVEATVPRVRDGEVLIEVAYAGVNRPDCLQRSGAYPPPPDASPILGLEVAGRVVAKGNDVTSWKEGDEVCALVPGGGYARYCATPAAWSLPIPKGVALRDSAGLPETHFTVWNNLFDRAHLKSGDWVLVHGGTSGIGLTAIQLAKAFGANVITTAGSPDKVAFCREIGADHAIDYKSQDFVDEVANMTSKRGVDIILDMVGGDYLVRNLKSLALEGRLVLIAFLGGSRAEIDFRHVMMRRLTITGSTLRASPPQRKVELAKSLEENVWPLYAQGQMRIVTHAVFPLEEASKAHALMESSRHIGKILLDLTR